MKIRGDRVANTLVCNATTHGLLAKFSNIPEIHFLETIQSPEQRDLVCVTWQELTATCNVSGDNW